MNPMPMDIAISDVDKLILSGGQIPSESSEGLSSLGISKLEWSFTLW